jgi:putative membrane protein
MDFRTVFLLSLFAVTFCASAQERESEAMQHDRTAAADATTSSVSEGDRRFLQLAADAGAKEIQLSQRAVEKAQDPEVRRFAQRMADEHSKMNSELLELTEKLLTTGGPPYKKASPTVEREVNQLAQLSGADFDKRYMEIMVKDHAAALRLFQRQAAHGNDAQLRAFAQKGVPTLEEHLAAARELATNGAPH